MSGKNLPGGLIHIKDNGDGTLSYVFDKFCIFEKGYMNGPYSPLIPLIQPTTGGSIPVFNYGNTGGTLFYITDGKGDTITVQQNAETGSYTLTFPAINTNDTLVTTNLAQTLTNKTLITPILSDETNSMQFGTPPDYINIEAAIRMGSGMVNLVLPGIGTTILTDTSLSTLTNKTLSAPIFSGVSSGILQNVSQYCFKAYVSSGGVDVTGDGTAYQIIFNTVDFQVGTGYNSSTGTFTAPIAGLYHFTANLQTSGWSSTNTTVQSYFVHNTTIYNMQMTSNISYSYTYLVNNFSTTFNMAANDTVTVWIQVGGEPSGTKNISIVTGSMNTNLIGTLLVATG